MWYLRKNEIKPTKQIPHLYTYEPSFQKFWIHPCAGRPVQLFYRTRPPDKSAYWKTIFFISRPKHMLWVLKRTVSMSKKIITNFRASPASLRCGPLARHIYPSLVLVQPRKTRPCLTERLLMGHKESNQTNKQKQFYAHKISLSGSMIGLWVGTWMSLRIASVITPLRSSSLPSSSDSITLLRRKVLCCCRISLCRLFIVVIVLPYARCECIIILSLKREAYMYIFILNIEICMPL